MVRVVIADDSVFFLEVLKEVLEADGTILVVGEAADGRQAVRMTQALSPDLVTMDVAMPRMDGLSAIEEIMAVRPTPILVLTAQPAGPGTPLPFEATRRGALDIMEKRVVGRAFEGGETVRDHVRSLASVSVVRHPRPSRPVPTALAEAAPLFRLLLPDDGPKVVGIGASAGGPAAVAAVLAALPADFGASVAVVQHIPDGFADSFVSFLREHSRLPVEMVQERTALSPGVVYVPRDERHLVASGRTHLEAVATPPERGHRPSVDRLLRSLAVAFGPEAAGVLLTGMGDDGARGLGELKARGGYTVVQDEASSAVWGMPRVAVELGAACVVLPLSAIGRCLAELDRRGRPPGFEARGVARPARAP